MTGAAHVPDVKNIKLVIEYDGTGFCGWQRQPRVRTVEGETVKALEGILGFEPEMVSGARTDSGVHALGQVVNFSSTSRMEPAEILNALNSLLPPDIRIVHACEVPLAFNARFDAARRVYRYDLSTRPTAVWRNHRWYVKWDLDVAAMNRAVESLIGEHDFTAYTSKDEDRNPWINLMEARVEAGEPSQPSVALAANRFLRRMVRILTGTLVEVGRGRLTPVEVHGILLERDRGRVGPCAPPHGLYLVAIDY